MRPVFLNLFAIRMPVGAVVSILHRVTGVLLVLLLPLALYLLQLSLESGAGFARVQAWFESSAAHIAVLACVAVYAQHFFSGLRHLLLDLDVGTALPAARRSAGWAYVGSALVVVAVGIVLI